MATIQGEFAAIDEGVWELGRIFDPESWKDQHDEAMRCREFERRMASNLPSLRAILNLHRGVFEVISSGPKLDVRQRSELWIGYQRAATMMSYIIENVAGQVAALEGSGFEVAGSWEYLSLLRSARDNLGNILDQITAADLPTPDDPIMVEARPGPLRLPDPPFETDEGPAPFDLPRPSGGKTFRVTVRPGPIRLPDPLIETEEGPAPFDLPVLGKRYPVELRWVPPPLPDLIDE